MFVVRSSVVEQTNAKSSIEREFLTCYTLREMRNLVGVRCGTLFQSTVLVCFDLPAFLCAWLCLGVVRRFSGINLQGSRSVTSI
jgi:hypothetical protein